ncbi:MAG: quinolinate synthase NadA, partial [Candidatus Methanomethylicia archaeon]
MAFDFDKFENLKRRLNAVVVAHNYQLPEVQDIADFIGDSLEMAFRAVELSANVVVVAGVRFMAELVAAMNPDKIVLHPDPSA